MLLLVVDNHRITQFNKLGAVPNTVTAAPTPTPTTTFLNNHHYRNKFPLAAVETAVNARKYRAIDEYIRTAVVEEATDRWTGRTPSRLLSHPIAVQLLSRPQAAAEVGVAVPTFHLVQKFAN